MITRQGSAQFLCLPAHWRRQQAALPWVYCAQPRYRHL